MSTTFKSTRKAAREAGDVYYFTGAPCKSGHVERRFVSCGACEGCLREYRENNREVIVKRVKKYHLQKPEKARKRFAKWRKKNKGVANAIAAKRRAAKLNATPSWLSNTDLNEIKQVYRRCAEKTKRTGVAHHVDHIIPLQGENVSGLHVPWNLQVLTASANSIKGNQCEHYL